MEGKAMVVEQNAHVFSGACLPVGEPVTLVIEEERFFGWVASTSPAHSLACVAIEFKRGSNMVQELIIGYDFSQVKQVIDVGGGNGSHFSDRQNATRSSQTDGSRRTGSSE